jgi:hypothetical protein
MKSFFHRTAYWGAFLSLGPITGPLIEGIYRNWRKGEKVLAGLYALAVVTSLIALPALLLLATQWAAGVKR